MTHSRMAFVARHRFPRRFAPRRGASGTVGAPAAHLGRRTAADQYFNGKIAADAVQAFPASIHTLGACRGQPFVFGDLFLYMTTASSVACA